ncbi:hypothetical protein GCM10028797_06390 [Dyella agri]
MGVLGEALGQRLHALAGLLGERGEALAEAVDALALLARHAIQLFVDVATEALEALLQFLAATALFFAQRALQALVVVPQGIELRSHPGIATAAQQQGDLQCQYEHDEDDEQGFAGRHGQVSRGTVHVSVRPAVAGLATSHRIRCGRA